MSIYINNDNNSDNKITIIILTIIITTTTTTTTTTTDEELHQAPSSRGTALIAKRSPVVAASFEERQNIYRVKAQESHLNSLKQQQLQGRCM